MEHIIPSGLSVNPSLVAPCDAHTLEAEATCTDSFPLTLANVSVFKPSMYDHKYDEANMHMHRPGVLQYRLHR